MQGDSGEALDRDAIAAYKDRVTDLRAEITEAESWGDSARVSRAQAEIEAIADELAHGTGLGGKARKVGSDAERARINVRRRLTDTIERIEADLPELGTYLRGTVKTGTWCVYKPT